MLSYVNSTCKDSSSLIALFFMSLLNFTLFLSVHYAKLLIALNISATNLVFLDCFLCTVSEPCIRRHVFNSVKDTCQIMHAKVLKIFLIKIILCKQDKSSVLMNVTVFSMFQKICALSL